MAWKQVKSFFKPKRKVEVPVGGGASPASAVPTRLNVSSKGTGSAPPSPSAKRRADAPEMMRSPSAPVVDVYTNSPPEDSTTPLVFSLIAPLAQVYAPMTVPYITHAQEWYEKFRDGDQKSFWLTHAFIALILLYLLSSMLLFTFKLLVFAILMYSTGWTVYTSELFRHNEATKRYAYIGTGLIGLYLFMLLN